MSFWWLHRSPGGAEQKLRGRLSPGREEVTPPKQDQEETTGREGANLHPPAALSVS